MVSRREGLVPLVGSGPRAIRDVILKSRPARHELTMTIDGGSIPVFAPQNSDQLLACRFPGPIACAGPAACYAVGENGTILAVNTVPGPANCTEPGNRSSTVSLGRRPAG
jgi:hypothetical protein